MVILIDSLAILFLILCWWVAASSYPRLPESIPTHFGFSGEADAWGGRRTIFFMPAIATFIFALDYFLFSKVMAGGRTPAAMQPPLHLLLLEVTILFTYITWRMSEVAFGRAKGLGVWFLPATLLATFGTVGWVLVAGMAR